MVKITSKIFSMAWNGKKVSSWPQHGIHHVEMTAWPNFKFPSLSVIDVPMDFRPRFFSAFCPKKFLHRHRFKMVSMQSLSECLVFILKHPIDFSRVRVLPTGLTSWSRKNPKSRKCALRTQVHKIARKQGCLMRHSPIDANKHRMARPQKNTIWHSL